jgi:hypothetical protein
VTGSSGAFGAAPIKREEVKYFCIHFSYLLIIKENLEK